MKYALYIKCLYKNLPPTALQPIGSFRAMQLIYDCKGGGIPRNLSEKRKKTYKFTRSKTHFLLFAVESRDFHLEQYSNGIYKQTMQHGEIRV